MKVEQLLKEIYEKGIVKDAQGRSFKVDSHISKDEGEWIQKLIKTHIDVNKTLEIGCAYGSSSLFICAGLAGRALATHIIIDPYQNSDWHGIGVYNLKRAGFDFFELIEKPSEFALPEIVQKSSGTFDLVFIDGWHTFDHTLLDLFYANRLVKVGGFIVVDDCNFPSVAKAVDYMLAYPAYQLYDQAPTEFRPKQKMLRSIFSLFPNSIAKNVLPLKMYDRFYLPTRFTSMVAIKKVTEDQRSWNWYQPF